MKFLSSAWIRQERIQVVQLRCKFVPTSSSLQGKSTVWEQDPHSFFMNRLLFTQQFIEHLPCARHSVLGPGNSSLNEAKFLTVFGGGRIEIWDVVDVISDWRNRVYYIGRIKLM